MCSPRKKKKEKRKRKKEDIHGHEWFFSQMQQEEERLKVKRNMHDTSRWRTKGKKEKRNCTIRADREIEYGSAS